MRQVPQSSIDNVFHFLTFFFHIGQAGAVDEELFYAAFEDVPSVNVSVVIVYSMNEEGLTLHPMKFTLTSLST